jgi:hypothetical protein
VPYVDRVHKVPEPWSWRTEYVKILRYSGRCGLTNVAADERVIVVGFLAFQASRLRRGNTIVHGW